MLRVGLTGGLASGKTFVGEVLAQLGCHLVDADRLGHEALAPGGAAYGPVIREFGEDVLEADGTIDRRRLGAYVFERPERLEVLNSLVHPAVIRREEELLAGYAACDPGGIAVVEAAILIETGSHRRFERIILAVCEREQQIERAMARDNLTRQEAEVRLSRQMSLEEKRKFADYVIDTRGSKEDTQRQVKETYQALRSIRP